MTPELKRLDNKLSRIEKLLEALNKPKPTWTKVSAVRHLTGWDANKIRRAREVGLIEWKRENGGFFYNINSLNPLFYQKTA